MFTIYEIINKDDFRKKDSVNLKRELQANGVNNFDFVMGRDSVHRIKIVGGDRPTHLRVYLTVNGKDKIANIKLTDGVADLAELVPYKDEPIFTMTDED